ncbi:LysR family transcriptional regulator [Geomonas sp. Red32]|uniref:LysR family transcriptional regulator n=1 Tax=Geomonas sp. Red32 TaxID=2912856 RepID=UPI00202CD1AA|nr:LysR family transcriptional regulator [Geomonas sp. Red32]MCM0082576.1 LysR family transcriptional regulator [Geomonas sp. Red32]
MNLNRLRIFHAAAQCQSFTKAADLLHLTQPGVSKHVKHLEAYYGEPLFDRVGRKVMLTRAGEILYQATSAAFALLEQAKLRIGELSDLTGGKLRIGGSVTIATYILPEMLARFRKLAPGVEISVATGFRNQILEQVLDNTLEAGFVGEKRADERLVFRRFMTDDLLLIVPPGHRWAGRKRPVHLGELAGEVFVLSSRGAGTWRLVSGLLASSQVTPRDTMELGTTEGLKQAVAAGLGVSIVSRHVVHGELARGLLVALPLEGAPLKRELFAVYHKARYLSKAARAFLELFGVEAEPLENE